MSDTKTSSQNIDSEETKSSSVLATFPTSLTLPSFIVIGILALLLVTWGIVSLFFGVDIAGFFF